MFGTYGVASPQPKPANAVERLQQQIAVRGFAVTEPVLTASQVEDLNLRMDAVYARQCEEVGGEDQLARINDVDIVRCLLAYDDAFLTLALQPLIIEVARACLGENITLIMQNGVINRPDKRQFQTNWHRDLNYQHWVSTRPLAISALVCLEDFTPETGGTVFLASSHKFEPFPGDDVVQGAAVAPDAPKGSVILFDSMVFHRAGVNRSGRVRRAVNHVLGAPILAQQVDLPAMLDRPAPADPWLAGYLGYRWNPVQDVARWRRRKIEKAPEAEA